MMKQKEVLTDNYYIITEIKERLSNLLIDIRGQTLSELVHTKDGLNIIMRIVKQIT